MEESAGPSVFDELEFAISRLKSLEFERDSLPKLKEHAARSAWADEMLRLHDLERELPFEIHSAKILVENWRVLACEENAKAAHRESVLAEALCPALLETVKEIRAQLEEAQSALNRASNTARLLTLREQDFKYQMIAAKQRIEQLVREVSPVAAPADAHMVAHSSVTIPPLPPSSHRPSTE